MATVKNTSEHILGSLKRDAASYISKPFSREKLLNTLRDALNVPVGEDDILILSDKPDWISLQVRCRLATADRLTQFVRELPSDLQSDEREHIATAFRELLINAVEHGGHLDPEKTVSLSYIRTARSIVYYIRDPGEGFSMEHLAHAAVSTPGDPLRHIGLRRDGHSPRRIRNADDEKLRRRVDLQPQGKRSNLHKISVSQKEEHYGPDLFERRIGRRREPPAGSAIPYNRPPNGSPNAAAGGQ